MTGAAGARYGGADERRWVLREVDCKEPYYLGRDWQFSEDEPRDAERMTRENALGLRRDMRRRGFKCQAFRLVSRQEAMERMRQQTLAEVREIVSAAPNQQAAWDEIGKLMEMGR